MSNVCQFVVFSIEDTIVIFNCHKQIFKMTSEESLPIEESDGKKVSNFAKFRLLMWKNFLIQYRHPVQTVFDIFAPVLFTILMILIRSEVDPEINRNNTYYKSFEIDDLNSLRLVKYFS